ncbi:glutamate racemase [Candidatus Parcubacteria bacterium]|nr:glutamate racemase [Candidatus Parcubacteria bacterium]
MIGVFDSGFGGLTILKQFLNQLPQYNYLYLGDNARAPYGNKSQEVIYNYTKEAVDFLFKQGCELIIIACNTASAKALRKIQQEWLLKHQLKKRVLGVVIPIAEQAVKSSRFNRIGIIGTRATVESRVYEQELNKLLGRPSQSPRRSRAAGLRRGGLKTGLKIYSQACPLLVPLIEEAWLKKPETRMILKKYLRPFKQKKIDTLILGCTHYPFLIKDIQRIMGKNCQVLDSPKIVAEKLQDYLERHPEIEGKISKNKKRLFYTTDDPARIKQFGEKFLGEEIREVKRVEL